MDPTPKSNQNWKDSVAFIYPGHWNVRYLTFCSDRIPMATIKAIKNKYGVGTTQSCTP